MCVCVRVACMNVKNVTISPIFYQTPDVRRDFVSVQCDGGLREGGGDQLLGAYEYCWKKYRGHMAIGAFDSGKMVGFSAGYQHDDKKSFYISDLYALSSVRKSGVASALLGGLESAASVYYPAVCLDIVDSDFDLAGMYNRRGYEFVDGNLRRMSKGLSGNLEGVVPIFKTTKTIYQACVGIVKEVFPYFTDKNACDFCSVLISGVNEYRWPVFVYVKDGNIVGFLQANRKMNDGMYLSKLCVLPRFQKRYGIGSALITVFLDHCSAVGVKNVELSTLPLRPELVDFCRKFGFYKTDRQGQMFFMEKTL